MLFTSTIYISIPTRVLYFYEGFFLVWTHLLPIFGYIYKKKTTFWNKILIPLFTSTIYISIKRLQKKFKKYINPLIKVLFTQIVCFVLFKTPDTQQAICTRLQPEAWGIKMEVALQVISVSLSHKDSSSRRCFCSRFLKKQIRFCWSIVGFLRFHFRGQFDFEQNWVSWYP